MNEKANNDKIFVKIGFPEVLVIELKVEIQEERNDGEG
jgi:hypothetical protein